MLATSTFRSFGSRVGIFAWPLLACIAVVGVAGCFKDADLSNLICSDTKYCPKGTICVIQAGQTKGECQSPSDGSSREAGATEAGATGATIDGLVQLDGPMAIDMAMPGLDGASALETGTLDRALDQSGDEGIGDSPAAVDRGEDMPLQAPEVRVDFGGGMGTGGSGGAIEAGGMGGAGGIDAGGNVVDAEVSEAGIGLRCESHSDCGLCQSCSPASKTCVVAASQDDPSGHCPGICDNSGVCKSKQGQRCASAADCSGVGHCVDGLCCDSACTDSCQACNITGKLGVCAALGAGETPRGGRTLCSSVGTTCGSSCDGVSSSCSYSATNGVSCRSASCSGSVYQSGGTCKNGSCSTTTQDCSGTDKCKIYSCSPSSGCSSTARACTGADKCMDYACDSSTGCVATAKNCTGTNKCLNYACDSATGCTSTTKNCGSSTACLSRGCSTSTGCYATAINEDNPCGSPFCSGEWSMIPSCISGVCDTATYGNWCGVDRCSASNGQCL